MSKTYFNYEQQIASKDLVEAISTPKGIGPFCGFGGHSISNDGKQIIITPEPGNGNSVAASTASSHAAAASLQASLQNKPYRQSMD